MTGVTGTRKLNSQLYQRSADIFLGMPFFNIASRSSERLHRLLRHGERHPVRPTAVAEH